MSKFDKLKQKILDGKSDANINFEDLRNLLPALGFVERIKGSHHCYRKEGTAKEFGDEIPEPRGRKSAA